MKPESRMFRQSAGLIALLAWAGLTVQFFATLDIAGTIGGTLWILVRYFTVLTNLATAIIMTSLALRRPSWLTPSLLAGTTLAITFVGIIFNILLRGMLELSGGARLADFILHYAVPLALALFWLVLAPKGKLCFADPLFWTIYPALYAAYALIRGSSESLYAYPFIDAVALGWPQTLLNVVTMLIIFLVSGLALVLLDQRLAGTTCRS